MTDSIDIIILIPGLTGSTLVEDQSSIGSLTPLWPDGALTAATEAATFKSKASAVEDVVTSMAGTLWPSRPLGADLGELYGSFMNSIASQLNSDTTSGTYSVICTSWPTVDYDNISNVSFDWLASGKQVKPNALNGNTLIGWAYDWRQDNFISARMLQNLLYNLNSDNDIGKITLIGHSMGGIVSRCYLENVGTGDAWFSLIDQFISLGTPNLGAPLALSSITEAVPSIVTGSVTSHVAVPSARTFPILNVGGWLQAGTADLTIAAATQQNMQYIILSTLNYQQASGSALPNPGVGPYQLLPPPELKAPNNGGTFSYSFIDIADSTPPQRLPLSPIPATKANQTQMQQVLAGIPSFQSNFDAALNLTSNLNYFNASPVPYNCIYGIVNSANISKYVKDVTTTVTAVSYDSTQTGIAGFSPVETDGGGDTIVPFVSASFDALPGGAGLLCPVTAVGFLGVDHDNMPLFSKVQTQVMTWLTAGS